MTISEVLLCPCEMKEDLERRICSKLEKVKYNM